MYILHIPYTFYIFHVHFTFHIPCTVCKLRLPYHIFRLCFTGNWIYSVCVHASYSTYSVYTAEHEARGNICTRPYTAEYEACGSHASYSIYTQRNMKRVATYVRNIHMCGIICTLYMVHTLHIPYAAYICCHTYICMLPYIHIRMLPHIHVCWTTYVAIHTHIFL